MATTFWIPEVETISTMENGLQCHHISIIHSTWKIVPTACDASDSKINNSASSTRNTPKKNDSHSPTKYSRRWEKMEVCENIFLAISIPSTSTTQQPTSSTIHLPKKKWPKNDICDVMKKSKSIYRQRRIS